MKTTSRRNLASLVFIAVLALIYLAVFLITESNHADESSIEKTASTIVAPIDSTAAQANAPTGKKKRKKPASKKQPTTKAPEPDRPDIFDRPVNKISNSK